jgi:hypothetical protein
METHDELDTPAQDGDDTQPNPVQGFENGDAPTPFSEASVIDLLQADMKELAEAKEAFIPVKGYERAGLQACYHMPASGKELDAIGRKVQREIKDNYTRNMVIAMDTMIYSVQVSAVQPAGVPEPVMLIPVIQESL